MEEILVSIWCPTYNHELYIKDAIEGFLSQKTNFRYEIIIHDDASSDRTTEIIKEYEKEYPDLIRGIYQLENQYKTNQPSIKWIQKIEAQNCRGKYIAICEGDDYWIDVQKLQLQVDFLENHPEYIMTVHDAINFDYKNYEIKSGCIYDRDCEVSAEDIIVQNKYMFSASILCRKEVARMSDFFLEAGIGDYTTLLYSLTKGKIYYISRIMSVYRQHHEGSWSHSFLEEKNMLTHSVLIIDFLKRYNLYTNHKYEIYVINRIQKSVDNILNFCQKKSKEEFSKICKKYSEEMGAKYQETFEALRLLWMLLFDDQYLNDNILEFASKYKEVVIMGAGKYAGIIAKKLIYHKISFRGFIISDNQRSVISYLEKPVWKLRNFPFGLKETGIIIGINPVIWDQIMLSLNDAGGKNYMCPFCMSLEISDSI